MENIFYCFFFSAGGLWTIQNISTVVNKAVKKHCNHFKWVTNRQLYECLKSIQKPQSLCSHWRNTFKNEIYIFNCSMLVHWLINSKSQRTLSTCCFSPTFISPFVFSTGKCHCGIFICMWMTLSCQFLILMRSTHHSGPGLKMLFWPGFPPYYCLQEQQGMHCILKGFCRIKAGSLWHQ